MRVREQVLGTVAHPRTKLGRNALGTKREQMLDIDGTRIFAEEQGDGPMVLLVHGFPELAFSWRHQLPALADAGYRAVAIEQRGYGRSSKYWRPDAYRIDHLAGDLVGVVRALGESQAVIVGHDWGRRWCGVRHGCIRRCFAGLSA